MASELACARGPARPFSNDAVTRAVTDSPHRGRPFVSLSGRAEFARVYRTGVRRRAGAVTVIAVAEGTGPPRVGVVAGRKVGKAVVRNRAKRRLREALARAELRDGTLYVVVALPGVATATYDEIVSWVRRGVRSVRSHTKKEQE